MPGLVRRDLSIWTPARERVVAPRSQRLDRIRRYSMHRGCCCGAGAGAETFSRCDGCCFSSLSTARLQFAFDGIGYDNDSACSGDMCMRCQLSYDATLAWDPAGPIAGAGSCQWSINSVTPTVTELVAGDCDRYFTEGDQTSFDIDLAWTNVAGTPRWYIQGEFRDSAGVLCDDAGDCCGATDCHQSALEDSCSYDDTMANCTGGDGMSVATAIYQVTVGTNVSCWDGGACISGAPDCSGDCLP